MNRFAALACLLLLSGAATAQKPDGEDAERDPFADPGRSLPYLAYTLGELHYLAYSCEGSSAQQWRARMIELLELEAPVSGNRRERLIRAFNDGYQVQRSSRIRCGAEAEAERRELSVRGQQLSDALLASVLE
ncbi:TIGR02301 family protein [Hyphobacterium marinum]|uniref:TIGR02301 family protein n=1 Tax=Hyphobacterium marinum TaxID=3116574 RepID=A0ABU7M0T4_9PROT|nr:TIGR02301 family protein [Hyphobacterium sp. Y6023]MEE2567416.1 TIGR02301 family protein [Hyphobacterium sp. Y6023]